jgi:putative ABC transport system substrate-binding protein
VNIGGGADDIDVGQWLAVHSHFGLDGVHTVRNAWLLCLILCVSPLVDPAPAVAQQPVALPRIGVLWPISESEELEAFRQGLRELGYVDHQNIVFEYRYARGKDELLPALAAELVALPVDIIVTYGVTAGKATSRATATIPIVDGSMSDPVAAGLAKSLARPGGNITGLTSRSPTLSAKRLQLLKEVVPGLSRVGVLSTPAPTAQLGLRESEAAARHLGLSLLIKQVQGSNDLEGAFSSMAGEGAQGLIVQADLRFNQNLTRVVALAAEHRLPATYVSKDFVQGGGLMSYGPNWPDQFRRAAGYVDKILKGAKPADLPIEAPEKFELLINMKAAKALGLTIPPAVMLRADELIQ